MRTEVIVRKPNNVHHAVTGFDHLWRNLLDDSIWNRIEPKFDMDDKSIREFEDRFEFTMDMPGVKKEDIKIELKDNTLHVSADRHLSHATGDKKENGRNVVTYSQTLELSRNIDSNKITASYENGVLTLTMAKAEAAKPRRIEIVGEKKSLLEKLRGEEKKLEKDVN